MNLHLRHAERQREQDEPEPPPAPAEAETGPPEAGMPQGAPPLTAPQEWAMLVAELIPLSEAMIQAAKRLSPAAVKELTEQFNALARALVKADQRLRAEPYSP
jgi:hypothetical protein